MTVHVSACGVLCSDCPAFRAREANDPAARERAARAWHELFALDFTADDLSCGGCQGADEDVFRTSRACKARSCCRSRAFATCGDCPDRPCADLDRAQRNWDGLEERRETLPDAVGREFFEPYCRARERVPGSVAPRE